MKIDNLKLFCNKFNKIFCYGAGKYGRVIREFLLEKNIKIDGFIVTGQDCEMNNLMGIPIYVFDELYNLDETTGIIIGVGKTYRNEILNMLIKHGVTNYFLITEDFFEEIEKGTAYDIVWNDNICILLYHRVCKLSLDVWNLAISPEIFELHIKYFKSHYPILRFDEDWSKANRPSLVITFDDGYADNLYNALPILEKYCVPATIFVCTGNIGTNKEFWWNELERIIFFHNKLDSVLIINEKKFPLTNFWECQKACREIRLWLKSMLPEERENALRKMEKELNSDRILREENRSLKESELRTLAMSPYITIGGHTVTHNMLSVESKEMQEREVIESKSMLETMINKPVTTFSYPFGAQNDFDDGTIEIVKKAGFEKAATTVSGVASKRDSFFTIPRNCVPYTDGIEEVQRHVKRLFCVT